jgi:hypothetical protein
MAGNKKIGWNSFYYDDKIRGKFVFLDVFSILTKKTILKDKTQDYKDCIHFSKTEILANLKF